MPAEPLAATALSDIARERGIRHFLIAFTDLFGVLRAKPVPAGSMRWRGIRQLRHLARHDTGRS